MMQTISTFVYIGKTWPADLWDPCAGSRAGPWRSTGPCSKQSPVGEMGLLRRAQGNAGETGAVALEMDHTFRLSFGSASSASACAKPRSHQNCSVVPYRYGFSSGSAPAK